MNEERSPAGKAFWRLYLHKETDAMPRDQVIRLAAIATNCPEDVLKAELDADRNAR